MIVLEKHERLRRRYPAELKKYGKGIFYITSKRLVFEADKHGAVFVLKFDRLYNWSKAKKSITIRWYAQEQNHIREVDRVNTFRPVGPIDSAEFKFDKKDGKKIDLEEVHYALFYALTDFYTYGTRGLGYYFDHQGNMYNHFFNHNKNNKKINRTNSGITATEIAINVIEESMMEKMHGEALLTHEVNKHFLLREAWKYDDRLMDNGALSHHKYSKGETGNEEYRGCGPESVNLVESLRNCIQATLDCIKRTEDEIKELEAAGNTGKLEEYIEPNTKPQKFFSFMFKGGNKYDWLQHCKNSLAIEKRILELVPKQEFKSNRQCDQYWIDLDRMITERFESGQDISDYAPEIKMLEVWTPKVVKHLKEFKAAMCTEVP